MWLNSITIYLPWWIRVFSRTNLSVEDNNSVSITRHLEQRKNTYLLHFFPSQNFCALSLCQEQLLAVVRQTTLSHSENSPKSCGPRKSNWISRQTPSTDHSKTRSDCPDDGHPVPWLGVLLDCSSGQPRTERPPPEQFCALVFLWFGPALGQPWVTHQMCFFGASLV